MRLIRFIQTRAGRVLLVLAGLAGVLYGALNPSLGAIVAMMTGAAVIVTGLAGVPRRHAPPRRPSERTAA